MNKNDGMVLFIAALVLGGLFLLMKRSPAAGVAALPQYSPEPSVSPDAPLRLTPRAYDNEEVREIEYNADGLPSRITIHRHARAS
jgi:hypothetical protein